MSLFSTKLQALKFVVKQSIFAFCLLLGTIVANAQSLTNAQLTALRAGACADILDPIAVARRSGAAQIQINGTCFR